MSYAPKPLRRRKFSTAPTVLLTSYDVKRASNHRAMPTVTPRGTIGVYTFPAPPGFIGSSAVSTSAASTSSTFTPEIDLATPLDSEQDDSASRDIHPHPGPPSDPMSSEHHLKATCQTETWATKVIPSLVPIYLRLLRTTQSLARPPLPPSKLCICGSKATNLDVVCVYFDCALAFVPH